MTTTRDIDTLIIGAGQAGLATAYHLAERGVEFAVLEADARVGDIWRRRYDSLRLYSPAKYDSLPGWDMPGLAWSWPTKDDMADYLEAYAQRFQLPVHTGVRVQRLQPSGDDYLVITDSGSFAARNVVVATGGWRTPHIPTFAAELDPGIRQLHSSRYRNPGQLLPGPVLVVGMSHSGADIALEVAATHPTMAAGPIRGELPFDIEGGAARVMLPIMWFAANHLLTERTPMGRALRTQVRTGGGPLLRVKSAHLAAAGVTHVGDKVVGVYGGLPVLADDSVLEPRNIIWCTGFRNDTSWIDFPVCGPDGWPEQSHGAVDGHAGLYFVGLPFQYAFASMLVGGVGRDAAEVARRVAKRQVGTRSRA
ncbi:FAD-dependent oxidoreductase [Skermania sp. ID1734]|uniref:flavin-containing monooxygenase n=1 Tax=Skermania sp. ID1734 TaxID=2597516 RepID=UPI00117D6F6B|nr:FAD-dependent oxidoreductase [Skermania sp. ID1734]TSD98180.1 FAD-dependent oxidoreductase [Skermania sp. ID1734]